MTLRAHIEHHLGDPEYVYGVRAPGHSFNILQFDGVPHFDAVSYVTEGVSSELVLQPSGSARQELVLTVRRAFASDETRRPLGAVAQHILNSKDALIRGEVIDFPTHIVHGTNLSAVCCLAPAIVSKDFWVYAETDPATMFVWLLPLTAAEAALARRLGPDEFEAKLETAQETVDLLNLDRPPFVQ